jgi:hypothetical protein
MNIENLMVSNYVKDGIEIMGEEIYYIYQQIKEETGGLPLNWKLRFLIYFNKRGVLTINFILETDTDKDLCLSWEAPIGHWAFVN